MSLTEYGLKGKHFIGLINYLRIIQDTVFLRSLLNTFHLVVAAVLLQLLIGFAVALILNKDFFGKSFVYWVILLPMIIAPVVVGLTFRILYDPSLGLINYLLGLVGIKGPEWLTAPNLAMLSIILIDTWQWSPFMALLLLAGLQYVPLDIYESAMVDGATPLQRFIYITLPLMKNIIALALIFRSLDCFNKTFDIIYMTTRGGPGYTTETIPTFAYKTAFTYLKFGKAAAQSIILFFAILLFIVLLRRVVREELITN
jgi:multiple sugar transport system permease protein